MQALWPNLKMSACFLSSLPVVKLKGLFPVFSEKMEIEKHPAYQNVSEHPDKVFEFVP